MALRDELRVMIVDDMSISRGLLAQALDSFGIHDVSAADDGTTAISAIQKYPVHLVISDYDMPNMNGLHLLHALRNTERTKGIGFILVTGHSNDEIIDAGRRLGMNNFLEKPFNLDGLRACIETVVGRL